MAIPPLTQRTTDILLTDLLTDLRHYCDRHGCNLADGERISKYHHAEEVAEAQIAQRHADA